MYIYFLEVLNLSIVKDSLLAHNGRLKIKWVQDYMPVLTKIGDEFAKSQIFAGLKIGMSIHMEAKTAYLALMLKGAGAEVYATGCNPLSTQDDVAAGLASMGVNVYAIRGVDNDEYFSHIKKVLSHEPDLLIDDGGDLYKAYSELSPEIREKWRPIGGCEETTTGINRLKMLQREAPLHFPMMNVNDAPCKHFYDNVYGTGQSVWTAIMDTTNTLVAGKTVVVAGYGYCGSGVAMRARGMGARVIVTEIDPVKALEASLDGFEVMPMDDAAYLGDYFVTVTGCKNVIRRRHFNCMKDNAFLANAGHFDVEINVKELGVISSDIKARRDNITGYTTNNKTLNLLASGRLVNLAAGQGHPAEIMDMSFALQAMGLKYLLDHKGQLEDKLYEIPEEVNERVARLKLEAMGIKIDTLTEEQREYLGR